MPRHACQWFTFGLCIITAISIAGCGGPKNTEIGLVGVEPLPALADEPHPTTTLQNTPSVSSLDRSSWSPVHVKVPVRQVEHEATYFSHLRPGDPESSRNVYPTAESALNTEYEAGEDISAAMVGIVVNMAMLPLTLVDLLAEPEWSGTTYRSSGEAYARKPADDGAASVLEWVKPIETPSAATPADSPDDDS